MGWSGSRRYALITGVSLALGVLAPLAHAGDPVRVGIHEAPPYSFAGEDGRPEGFAIDFLEAVAAEHGWDIEYVDGSWDSDLAQLEAGEIDLLVPVSQTAERSQSLEFSRESLMATWGQVFVDEGDTVETMLQLDGRRIAVVRDDAFAADLEQLLLRFEVEHEFVAAEDVKGAFALVDEGKAEAAAVERIDGGNQAPEFSLKPTPVLFHPTSARFAAPRSGGDRLLAVLDAELAEQKGDPDSAYGQALAKWFGGAGGDRGLPAWLFPVLIGLGGALLGSLLFVRVLRVRVAAATEQLRKRNEQLEQEMERRNLAEARLRDAQKMEAVGQLAAGVGHESERLVSAIQSRVEVLAEADDPQVRAAARAIRGTAGRVGHVTGQLLAFARKQTLEPEISRPNELLDGLADSLRTTAGGNIQVTLDLTSDVPDIEVDAGQLARVLTHLVTNARDAMPGGGRLTLSTDCVELESATGVLPAGLYAEIRVRDTGQGMDRDKLERVFEPFFTSKESTGPSGLGLSVAYGIVRQSGGDIRVTSEPGVGSTFSVLLPSAGAGRLTWRKATPSAPSASSSGHRRLPRTVLLVQADAGRRGSWAAALGASGFEVLAASDGRQAADLAAVMPDVGLLIADLELPDMAGEELLDKLGGDGGRPAVLFTARGDATGPAGSETIVEPTPAELVEGARRAVSRKTQQPAG